MTGYERLMRAKRFDMKRKPFRQLHILRPVTWAISYPNIWAQVEGEPVGMEGIKPPFLLLCTTTPSSTSWSPPRHLPIGPITWWRRRNFIGRGGSFAWSAASATQVHQRPAARPADQEVPARTGCAGPLPEAATPRRYHRPVARSSARWPSLPKVPVVMLNMHGNYLNSPAWNLRKRGVPLSADYSLLFTAEELAQTPVSEVNKKIRAAFEYDEYRHQREHNIKIAQSWRAEGLHKPLYQCAHCKSEYTMSSSGSTISCSACGKVWQMDELGQLSALQRASDETELITEFSHIPDWYEFQRTEVRKQIGAGSYHLEVEVRGRCAAQRPWLYQARERDTETLDGWVRPRGGTLTATRSSWSSRPSRWTAATSSGSTRREGTASISPRSMSTYYIYPQTKCSVTR